MTNKKAFKSHLVFLVTSLLIATPTMVLAFANSDYDEVGYEDLVSELSAKRQKLQQQYSPAGNPLRHLGIGFANSFSTVTSRRNSSSFHTSGIQLSVGTDLVSPEWYAEGIFRNYSPYSNLSEEGSLRELEGKIGYTNSLENIWHYAIGAGISDRFLKYSNSLKNISVDESAPSLVISTSIFAQVHKNLSVGAEVSGRTSMINTAAEQNSFDFALRLNTSL